MISKCSVKTINKVNSKAAIIFFLTHLAPQQNFYMWIPSGENEMGSIKGQIKFELQIFNYTYTS